jgi:hypothetical protein
VMKVMLAMAKKKANLVIPDDVPPILRRVIEACLQRDADERPTFEEAEEMFSQTEEHSASGSSSKSEPAGDTYLNTSPQYQGSSSSNQYQNSESDSSAAQEEYLA